MSSLTCSIIINTYNPAPYLERLLSGFEHLRSTDFEVVVVNAPSTDHTANILEKI
ncbi:MAG: glycosyltransferase family 2 protein [Anaerolineales bacterium]|nr:glycosyltransferase family 2 protein [Anaerolineales bacterium]